MQPPSTQLPAPHLQNAGDGSKPLPLEVRASVPNTAGSVPSHAPGVPANNVQPKKQPPPVAAKPKFPVSTSVTAKTKGIIKDDGKQLKPEKIQQKMLEIQRLELRPYLTASEQTRLQNLRVEVEFDKRLADINDKHEDNSDLEQHRMLPSTVRILLFTHHFTFNKQLQKQILKEKSHSNTGDVLFHCGYISLNVKLVCLSTISIHF